MNLVFHKYEKTYEKRWDDFVMNESINGTFLQSRNFLNYHPGGRFEDVSILIMSGSTIVAVVPAHKNTENEMVTFNSHKGSTFGGIVLGKNAYSVTYLEKIMPLLNDYLIENGYEFSIMKSTSDLFSKQSMALLDYEFFRNGYEQYNEIAFYLKCNEIPEDEVSMMTASRRRDYRYSLKNDFCFIQLKSDEQIKEFYKILCKNLEKFNTLPVHTLEELLDFKNNRLEKVVKFYGVYEDEKMVAGSMLFDFEHRILHTQYLACIPEYNKKFVMNYMDYNLIMTAKKEGYQYFSFGTSTGNYGRELNVGLALYKEGFGCCYSVNRTYMKVLKR